MKKYEKKNILETYSWINIQKFQDNKSQSWKERYKALEFHHIEETNFLISKIRDLVKKYC